MIRVYFPSTLSYIGPKHQVMCINTAINILASPHSFILEKQSDLAFHLFTTQNYTLTFNHPRAHPLLQLLVTAAFD